MEPNGAFAWAPDSSAYFERDSLAALTTVLTQFPSVGAIDRAVSALRRGHPHPQQILTITKPVEQVLAKIGQNLTGWRRETLATGLTAFAGGEDSYVAVRASGTEPVTRLYVEAPPRHCATSRGGAGLAVGQRVPAGTSSRTRNSPNMSGVAIYFGTPALRKLACLTSHISIRRGHFRLWCERERH